MVTDVYSAQGNVAEELALIFQKAAHQDRSRRIGRIAVKLKKGLNIVIGRSTATVEERSRQKRLSVSPGAGHGRATLGVCFLNNRLSADVSYRGGSKKNTGCAKLVAVIGGGWAVSAYAKVQLPVLNFALTLHYAR